MAILILILGTLIVWLMAIIFSKMPAIARAIVATAIGIGIGFWAMNTPWGTDNDNGVGLMSLIDILFKVPMLWGVGISMMLVTIGAESDGVVWVESFRIGDTSYGQDVGMPLIFKIFFAILIGAVVMLAVLAILGSIIGSIKWIYWLYFILQGLVCFKTIKNSRD